MAKKKSNGSGKFFLGIALGTITGGIAGMLTAPKSGKQTRKDIERTGKKVAKKAKTEAKKVGYEITKRTSPKAKK